MNECVRKLAKEITGWADLFVSGYNAAVAGLPESSIDVRNFPSQESYDATIAGYHRGKDAVQVREALAISFGFMKAHDREAVS